MIAQSPTALVLGAAVRPDGTASPTLRLRVGHAVDLFDDGRVGRICLTGGQGAHGAPEAHVARDLALSRGVSIEALLVEDRSTTTVENLIFAHRLVIGPVILVSNRWHLPRARLIAGIIGMAATVSGPRGALSLRKTMAAILREVAATPLSVVCALRWARHNGR
ncbi:YdcF family protein [Jannaschia donghaensis]|uniref:DUF218 domain-containing protein n=1 Tax=Jannaschia donghaensis TaxID=420998 RepID=A0A0M6YGZ8_9RHOB|nr:YdcF family protein [Jannaschia donghaensis]CTQ48965.1 hypothetical protein JDO7802_00973 [Jannaschia donghaensis]